MGSEKVFVVFDVVCSIGGSGVWGFLVEVSGVESER